MNLSEDYKVPGQMSIEDWLNQDSWSGKTSPEHSAATKEKTSESCLKKLRELRIKPPLFLDLRKESGQTADVSWETGGPLLGEYMMHSFGECPKDAVESHLSQILSGGGAPEILFERKSMSGDSEEGREPRKDSAGDVKTSIGETGEPILLESNQNNATIQTEGISTSLPASMGMGGGYVPMITDKCLNSWDVQSKHIQSENGVAEALYSGECRGGGGESYVLSSAISFQERAGKPGGEKELYNGNLTGNVAATLNATSGDSLTHSGSSVICYDAYQHHGWRKNDTCGTVTAGQNDSVRGDTPLVVLEGNGSRPSHQGDGYKESDVCYTLNSTEHHAVCVENCPADSRVKVRENGIVQTLNGQMGTGGGNVPMVIEPISFGNGQLHDAMSTSIGVAKTLNCMDDPAKIVTNAIQREVFCIGNGQLQQARLSPTVGTLNCMHDQQAVMAINKNIVRRLTPLECERLQGFPDGWTDIGDWIDSKGKTHKGDSDSPRYKALGNSIALPFWQWMAARMVSYMDHKPKMASLFDGISGFPLVFSRCGCEPIWSSEIEEFPIAVAKNHFPDMEEKE